MKSRIVLNTSDVWSLRNIDKPMNTARIPDAQNVTWGWMSNPARTMLRSPGSRSATSG